MDIGVKDKSQREMEKQSFHLKHSRKDGLLIQIHHTLPGNQGEERRVRFVHIAFDEDGEQLASSDFRSNVFVISLASCKYWLLVNLGSCSCLAFSPYITSELLVATSNGTLNIVNTEVGKTTGSLKGHSMHVTGISFAKKRFCLSASSTEAIIWDLQFNCQAHRLNLRSDVLVKKVLFMPASNHILACFQDDAIHVWNFETFQCVKQIVPEAWKSHHIKTIAFTKNGRAMVVGGHSPCLIVFALDNWSVVKVLEMPEGVSGIRHLEFLPGLFDGGSNKILCILTEKCQVRYLNIETCKFLPMILDVKCNIRTFTCSPNGKYLSLILHSGEVNVYSTARILESEAVFEKAIKHPIREEKSQAAASRQIPTFRQKDNTSKLQVIHKQIQDSLDLERLRPILKEFGEYPESYRPLIWKSVLQLPGNKAAYMGLVNRECSPAYARLEDQYPLENKSNLKNLKRLLSCLSHWCTLFGEVKFLPLFVFPFVKVFQNDPFTCFEAVVTIIVNWCQHWFEYFPFPPINILGMIENVLAHSDPELMHLFYEHNITSRDYAWPLLEVAFTEVLSVSEWLRLWDHILSNEPAFLLIAVAAYSITSRSALQTCQKKEDFEYFFHNPNPIDMKSFISKIYSLCRKIPADIHPRQYLRPFTPLSKELYPVYNEYPKFIVDFQAKQMEQIHREEEVLLQEQARAQAQRAAQETQIEEERRKELEHTRYQKLQETYRHALRSEEERIGVQRQKISALRRDIRTRELELLSQTQERLQRQHMLKNSCALQQFIDDISRKREQDNAFMANVEDELKDHLTDLIIQKEKLQMQLKTSQEEVLAPNEEHMSLQKQQEELRNEIMKLRKEASCRNHHIDLSAQIAIVDNHLQEAERELAKEMAQRHFSQSSAESNSRLKKLEATTKLLETEVQEMLKRLAELRFEKTIDQRQKAKFSGNEPLANAELYRHNFCHSVYQPNASGDTEFREGDGGTRARVRAPEKRVHIPSKYYSHSKSAESENTVITRRPMEQREMLPFLGDCRSPSYYQRQQNAIKAAMDVRERLLEQLQERR